MADNKWKQPKNPPPPLFTGKKEKDLVKQVNDELVERVIGQQILYYPISIENTEFHPIYGEAIEKNFLNPIRVHALVEWQGYETETTNLGVDRRSKIVVHFHKRRLTEDQNLFVREGDFVLYGETFYEIVTLNEPKQLFGQIDSLLEISAECVKSREGLFNAT
tara:strand:+ start:3931 stop:4419 length:489 start_codon:yes stop_codon:yes gene_type:complete